MPPSKHGRLAPFCHRTRLVGIFLLAASLLVQQKPGWAQQASPSPWSHKLLAGLNITQTGFSNWSEGGTDAVAYTATLQTELGYEAGRYRFTAQSKSVFGQTKQEGQDIRKAADEIRVDLSLVRKIGFKLDPYVAVTARTQFAEGFDYSQEPKVLRSDFLNPLYLIESLGLGIEPRPDVFWRLGLAFKQTGVRRARFAALFTDDPATPERLEKWRTEAGLETTFSASLELTPTLSYRTRLGLFTNFERLQTADVNWENLITAKVARFINVSLDFVLFYDEDISTRTQLKEVVSIGFAYEIH